MKHSTVYAMKDDKTGDGLPPLPLIAEVDTSYFAYSDYPIKYIDGYEAGFRNGQEHMLDQMYSRDAMWAERLAAAVARERKAFAQHAIAVTRNAMANAAARERELCAQVCDARDMKDGSREDQEARRCAAAIRGRG